jgi:2-polyprenyl-3-methyl-5-hydroxy-6-metoxy-1,4-benzoquinol methylase
MAIEAIKTKKQLQEAVYGFRASRIILTAFELGLFSKLGVRSLAAAQLAAQIGAEPRACERLLNALCNLGLVKKARGLFRNTKISRDHLVAGKPQFLAGLTHSVSQWQSWNTLSAAVRRGTSVMDRKAGTEPDKRLQGFIAAMHERASAQAPRIVKMLDLSSVRRCLDIGAGSGAYAMALARAQKTLQAVAFDLPQVLPLTREYVRRERLLGRIDFMPGDFNRDSWGSGYDLVLLSAIVHMNDGEQNRRLIARAAASLNRGGQLVVQDFIMSKDRTRPAVGAVFALNMLVATAHGDSYTAAEIGSWMRAAGLKKIKKKNTPFDAALLIGWKP